METNSYKGWLNSDNFFKRCFGVFFYYFVANSIISIILIIVVGIPLFILLSTFLKPIYDQVDSYNQAQSSNIQNYK